MNNTHARRPVKRHRGLRALFLIVGLVILIAVAIAIWVGPKSLFDLVFHPRRGAQEVSNAIGTGIVGNQPLNLLLIANNARDASGPLSVGTGGGQADILIVVHIDPQKHQITLVSVPRDTLIALPNWNIPIPKIKTTFTLGLQKSPQNGPIMAMKYVSKMTGLPIHDYIVTDFQGFVDAINAIGGIPVTVPHRLYDPGHSGADISAGWHMLNGEQALAFIRVRQNQAGNNYRTNDFERQRAELEVLNILKSRLLDSTSNPAKIRKLVGVWQKDVVTNLSTGHLLGLAMAAAGSKMNSIYLGSVADSMDLAGAPAPGINAENYLTGAYYDVLDAGHIAAALKQIGSTGSNLGLAAIPPAAQVPVTVIGNAAVAAQLQKAGFPVTMGGSSASGNQVQIYYPPGDMPWGWAVARVLGTANEWVAPATSPLQHVVVYAP